MFKNKKGQISIEFLLVLSILVVGGVLFGVYYLQSIGKNRQEDVSTDILDYIITDFASDINVFEFPEPPQPPTQNFSISLELDPSGPTKENNDFNIVVYANNQTEYNTPKITQIRIFDSDYSPTTNCNLVNNGGANNSVYSNLNYYFVNDIYNLTLNCGLSGSTQEEYIILVFAEIEDDPNNYNNSNSISKTITPILLPPPINQTFSIDLELDPDSSSQVGADFGVVVSVDQNTIYDDPIITKIDILKEGMSSTDCNLLGVLSLGNQSTYSVNLPFDSDTNKHTLFFRCGHEGTTPQTYSISVDAEIDSNNDFTDTALIQKTIDPLEASGCVEFSGELVFDLPSGTYNNSQNLTLTYRDDPNCVGHIFYTLDGEEPSTTSTQFMGSPIVLNGNETNQSETIVKVKIFGTDSSNQEISTNVSERVYSFKVANPILSPPGQNGLQPYPSAVNVSLSNATSDSDMWWILSTGLFNPDIPGPPNTGQVYSSPIYINDTKRLNVRAYKDNYIPSDFISSPYYLGAEEDVCPPMGGLEMCSAISGDGTLNSPFLITSAKDLYCVREHQLRMSLGIWYKLRDADAINIFNYEDGWTPVYDSDGDLNGWSNPISGEVLLAGYNNQAPQAWWEGGQPLCHYKLTTDIDLDPGLLLEEDWYSEDQGFPSIGGLYTTNEGGAITDNGCGNLDFGFYGFFDGDHYTIDNLYMNRFDVFAEDNIIRYGCFGSSGLETYDFFLHQGFPLFGNLVSKSTSTYTSITRLNLDNPKLVFIDNAMPVMGIMTRWVQPNTNISRINISDANIFVDYSGGSFENLGGVAGENNGGEIRDVSVSGNFTINADASYVGGIVGTNYANIIGGLVGKITESEFNGFITVIPKEESQPYYHGGIAGYNSGEILKSKFIGNLNSSGAYVGGIAGYNSGEILKSKFIGNLNSSGAYVGGIAGENINLISLSFVDANISGASEVGGIAGSQICSQHYNPKIENSYAKVTFYLSENDSLPSYLYPNFGGLSSYFDRTYFPLPPSPYSNSIVNSYAVANFDNIAMSPSVKYCGGVTNSYYSAWSNISNSFFSSVACETCFPDYLYDETTGNYGVFALTEEELKVKELNFWDFDTIWDRCDEINDGYPYLRNNAPN